MQIVLAIGNRFGSFVGLRLHTVQAPEDQVYFTQGEPGHGRFDPLDGLHRGALVGCGDPMEILGTVGVIEHLTRVGKQGLDMFPDPLGPVTDDA